MVPKLTDFNSNSIPVLNKILEDIDLAKPKLKYTNVLPSTKNVNMGELHVYDDGDTIQRMYFKTHNGTLSYLNIGTDSDFPAVLPISRGGTYNTSYTEGMFLTYDGTRITSSIYGPSDLSDGDAKYFKLDQTYPQTIDNGVPIFDDGLTSNGFVDIGGALGGVLDVVATAGNFPICIKQDGTGPLTLLLFYDNSGAIGELSYYSAGGTFPGIHYGGLTGYGVGLFSNYSYSDVSLYVDATGLTNIYHNLYLNSNSSTALLVEQNGVKDNVLLVDTTSGLVGINMVPVNAFDVTGAAGFSSGILDCGLSNNVTIGIGSGDAITTGDYNVTIGWGAGTAITEGLHNIFIGKTAGTASTGAPGGTTLSSYNVGIGTDSLQALTSGKENTALGNDSGYPITTGHYNTFIGDYAGYGATATISSNVCLGFEAGYDSSADGRLYISSGRDADLITGDFSFGYVNIGTAVNNGFLGVGLAQWTLPQGIIEAQGQGSAKSDYCLLALTNTATSADMDGTGTAINFYQMPMGETSVVQSGAIVCATETDWTGTASTKDSRLVFYVVDGGALTEVFRLRSDKTLYLNGGAIGNTSSISMTGQLTNTLAIGTSPFAVTSTTVNTNLNADLWDGYQFADYLNQAVKTTSTPQFSLLGVGGAAVGNQPLTVINAAATSGSNTVLIDQDWTATGSITNSVYALKITSDKTSTASSSYYNQYGLFINVNDDTTGGGSNGSAYGIYSAADSDQSQVNCYGFYGSATGLGVNYAVFGDAVNGTTNYSFYGSRGTFYNAGDLGVAIAPIAEGHFYGKTHCGVIVENDSTIGRGGMEMESSLPIMNVGINTNRAITEKGSDQIGMWFRIDARSDEKKFGFFYEAASSNTETQVAYLTSAGDLVLGSTSVNNYIYFQADSSQWIGSRGNGVESYYYNRGILQLAYWNNAVYAAGTYILSMAATAFDPVGTGLVSSGTSSNYWNDISYKTITDRGCLGCFDDGVELQDGSKVSDVEAIKAIKMHPSKKTVYGVSMLDYKTFPKVSYKPASDSNGRLLPRDKNDEPYLDKEYKEKKVGDEHILEEVEVHKPASDGVEMTSMFSIMLGAIKELDARLAKLEVKE